MRIAKRAAIALRLGLNIAASVVPRSRRCWVFGHSNDQFAGNPKFLYLWMLRYRPDVRVTWITGSERTRRMLEANGLPVAIRRSPSGVLRVLRAKVVVFGNLLKDVNQDFTARAFRLNLWHGVGLKALPWFEHYQEAAERRRPIWLGRVYAVLHPPYTVVISTSNMMQAHFAQQFRLPPGRCPQLGYPRLDGVTDPELAADAKAIDHKAGFELNPDGRNEIYVYMPTWRDTKRPFLKEALPDPVRLSEILAARGALLYIKLHPLTRESFPRDLDNIRLWPDEIDVNVYLPEITGLITDYSSVIYDYLFARDKGAILYTFDYDAYIANDRALLYPFDENVAGLRVSSFDELCEALERGTALTAAASQRVDVIRERFWGGSRKPASPAIVEWVERQLTVAQAC